MNWGGLGAEGRRIWERLARNVWLDNIKIRKIFWLEGLLYGILQLQKKMKGNKGLLLKLRK